jgi:predicted ATPase
MLSSTQGDRQAELVANTALMDVHFWLGNFEQAESYLSRALPLYDEESDVHLMKNYAFDMKMLNLIYASHFQWMMGYPARALRTKAAADAWAKRLNNPFMFVFADVWGSGVFHYAVRLDDHRRQLQEGLEISKRLGMPFFVAQAEIWSAWNNAETGDRSDATIALFDNALSRLAETGVAGLSYLRALHAEALSQRDATSQALTLLHSTLDRVQGIGEAAHAAEILRIRAAILARDGAGRHDEAEEGFIESLTVARNQKAKAWELRSTISYARFLKEHGRAREARELLEQIYDWFTEGFDTKDLKDANALLGQLS